MEPEQKAVPTDMDYENLTIGELLDAGAEHVSEIIANEITNIIEGIIERHAPPKIVGCIPFSEFSYAIQEHIESGVLDHYYIDDLLDTNYVFDLLNTTGE